MEPSRTRTAWIEVDYSRPFRASGLVRMPAHHHTESRGGRVKIERLDIMQHVDQRVACFRHGRFRKRIGPGTVIGVAPDGHHGRQLFERFDDFRSADVTRVDDQFAAAQRLERFLPQKAMRVGNNSKLLAGFCPRLAE